MTPHIFTPVPTQKKAGRRVQGLRPTLFYLAILSLAQPLAAQQLDLSTAPPAGVSKWSPPAPNVIISVDDSGSMGWDTPIRMDSLKAALKDTFTEANVPYESIRLGWQSLRDGYKLEDTDYLSETLTFSYWNPAPSNYNVSNKGSNAIRVYDKTRRDTFLKWVDNLYALGGTPTHRMLANAGNYLQKFSTGDINSPWADIPGKSWGKADNSDKYCRKSYTILMTDGAWNTLDGWNAGLSAGIADNINYDGTAKTLPDGTAYNPSDAVTRIFTDTHTRTLADLAMYYWSTDLQPGIQNKVNPHIVVKGSETVGSTTVPEYWNPKNDPATWQHMTLYTIGFKVSWAGDPVLGTGTWSGTGYENLLNGSDKWFDTNGGAEDKAPLDMWHAAINGRGKYVPATTTSDLTNAFKDILNDINLAVDASPPTASMVVSSGNTRQDSTLFTSSYDTELWSGQITAYNVAASTAQLASTGLWGTISGSNPAAPKTTASLMDESTFNPENRTVFTYNSTTKKGIDWKWDQLTDAQKDELNINPSNNTADTLGESRLNYLRGDRSLEGSTLRTRASRHGDIVNSVLWYTPGTPADGYAFNDYASFVSTHTATPRTPMIYVGANDGMLHGFEATTGVEKIAYIPEGLHGKLAQLSDPNYRHQYYVDGSPLTADVHDGTQWNTYLAGFLGAGGKGYFVLNVTDPSDFASVNSASRAVVLDSTATVDKDIGYIFGQPSMENPRTRFGVSMQISKLNNGRWALVSGNGYNSENEEAVLLIQYLDGDKKLEKIKTGARGGNGLSTPRLVDLNGDLRPDVAYAGDLQGNMWKFDLTSGTTTEWKLALGGKPLVKQARSGDSSAVQAITNAPTWLPHPNGGLMLVFGAGRNLTDADSTNTDTMAVFGVYDNTPMTRDVSTNKISFGNSAGVPIVGKAGLIEQKLKEAAASAETIGGSPLWTITSNEVDYSKSPPDRGWYMDLPVDGERLLKNISWFAGNLIEIISEKPAKGNTSGSVVISNTCIPPSVSVDATQYYSTIINAINGKAPESNVYLIKDGGDKTASRTDGGLSLAPKLDSENVGDDAKGLKCIEMPGVVCDDYKYPSKMVLHPEWQRLQ